MGDGGPIDRPTYRPTLPTLTHISTPAMTMRAWVVGRAVGRVVGPRARSQSRWPTMGFELVGWVAEGSWPPSVWRIN